MYTVFFRLPCHLCFMYMLVLISPCLSSCVCFCFSTGQPWTCWLKGRQGRSGEWAQNHLPYTPRIAQAPQPPQSWTMQPLPLLVMLRKVNSKYLHRVQIPAHSPYTYIQYKHPAYRPNTCTQSIYLRTIQIPEYNPNTYTQSIYCTYMQLK